MLILLSLLFTAQLAESIRLKKEKNFNKARHGRKSVAYTDSFQLDMFDGPEFTNIEATYAELEAEQIGEVSVEAEDESTSLATVGIIALPTIPAAEEDIAEANLDSWQRAAKSNPPNLTATVTQQSA